MIGNHCLSLLVSLVCLSLNKTFNYALLEQEMRKRNFSFYNCLCDQVDHSQMQFQLQWSEPVGFTTLLNLLSPVHTYFDLPLPMN